MQPNKKPVKKLTREEKDRKLQEVKKELHRMINEYRRSKGVKELEWSKEGEKGSNIRAEEISRLFSHTRPNGKGYDTAFEYMSDVWGSGENIEYLSNNLIETKSPKEIAKKGFELWKNSDGHNRNMLNNRYDEQSLGVYEKDRVLYISENLFIKNIEIERPKEDTTRNQMSNDDKKSNQMSNDEFNRIKPEIKRIFINKINDQRRKNGLKPLVHESDFQRTPTECGYINSVFKKEIQCSLDYAIETKGHGGVDAEEIGNKIFEDAKEKENYSFNSKDYVAYNFTVDYENGNIEYSLVMIKEVINKYDLGIYTVEK